MSKKYKIETTGDKVEVVEVVPDICKNYTVEHQRECGINSTRYATIPSDRDFWLAKQGEVFGEECFEVQGMTWPIGNSTTHFHTVNTAIPRKEDDVDLWDEAFNECYKQFATTLDHSYIMRLCMDYLKQHYQLIKRK